MIWLFGSYLVLSVAAFVWLEYSHQKERKDLYNRLMARDFTEYASRTRSSTPRRENFVEKGLRQSLKQQYGE